LRQAKYTCTEERNNVMQVEDFGADPTGLTDSTAAFQAASDCGGEINFSGKYRIDGDLYIRKNTSFVGDWLNPDIVGTSAIPAYQDAYSAIRLSETATIHLESGACFADGIVYRQGMTFPVDGEDDYAGLAFKACGAGVKLENILVMGFNKIFSSNGHQRHHLSRVYGDNVNGIEICGSPDIDRIEDCHMWPFAANTLLFPNPAVLRSGKAFYLHDVGDWTKLTNCFSYGYKIDYHLHNVNSCTLLNCSGDSNYPNAVAGSRGIMLTGTSTDTRLIGCQIASHEINYLLSANQGTHTQLIGCNAWASSAHNYLVSNGGDVTVTGGTSRTAPYAVSIDNSGSRVFVNGLRMSAISVRPFITTMPTNNLHINDCDFGDLPFGAIITDSNAKIPTIASADALLLPASWNIFNVSGNVSFGNLKGGYAGREVTFIFQGNLTVGSSTGNSFAMRLNGNFNATPNSTLTLKHNGVQWFETSRTV
jgi:hypothetical protein